MSDAKAENLNDLSDLLNGDGRRVITEKDGKVFSCQAVVSYLDNPHFDVSDAQVVLDSQPLRTYNEEGKLIGFTIISLENEKLVGKVSMDYSTPERLVVETKTGKYYLRLVGDVVVTGFSDPEVSAEGSLGLDMSRKPRAAVISIKAAVITSKGSGDARLYPLGDEILA